MSLEASNEFLKERVINLPQSKVEGTHNTEEGTYSRIIVLRILLQVNVQDSCVDLNCSVS